MSKREPPALWVRWLMLPLVIADWAMVVWIVASGMHGSPLIFDSSAAVCMANVAMLEVQRVDRELVIEACRRREDVELLRAVGRRAARAAAGHPPLRRFVRALCGVLGPYVSGTDRGCVKFTAIQRLGCS